MLFLPKTVALRWLCEQVHSCSEKKRLGDAGPKNKKILDISKVALFFINLQSQEQNRCFSQCYAEWFVSEICVSSKAACFVAFTQCYKEKMTIRETALRNL